MGPGDGNAAWEGTLFTVNVADAGHTACDLPTFAVKRPCYLADLRAAGDPAAAEKFTVDLGPPPQINGETMPANHAVQHEFEVGTIQEWELLGVDGHPFHMHVNPFQLLDDDGDSEYFQAGDWHDVLLVRNTGDHSVRFQTDYFTGKVIIHCHILEHEDEGMMQVLNITGTEGTTVPNIAQLDSTCYTETTGSRGFTISSAGTCSATGTTTTGTTTTGTTTTETTATMTTTTTTSCIGLCDDAAALSHAALPVVLTALVGNLVLLWC